MKAGYTVALSAAGWVLVARLSRPAASTRAPFGLLIAVIAAMLVAGAVQLMATPAADMPKVWLGPHMGSVPPSHPRASRSRPSSAWCLRSPRSHPTRLVSAGAAIGLLAGAAAATVYGIACDETTAAFTATWYTLGIGACAAIGAVLGPRLLRW